MFFTLKKHTKTISLVMLTLVVMVSLDNIHIAKANGLRIRPPYSGTYRLTAFFDHNFPNYGNDDEITIYTGESVDDCTPHCYEGHSGVDWALPAGTAVLAAADGTVVELFESNVGYGNSIVIEHSNGYHTLYAHLRAPNPFNVAVDDQVSAGDIIGWSGETGSPGAAHLHFGVYRVNPRP